MALMTETIETNFDPSHALGTGEATHGAENGFHPQTEQPHTNGEINGHNGNGHRSNTELLSPVVEATPVLVSDETAQPTEEVDPTPSLLESTLTSDEQADIVERIAFYMANSDVPPTTTAFRNELQLHTINPDEWVEWIEDVQDQWLDTHPDQTIPTEANTQYAAQPEDETQITDERQLLPSDEQLDSSRQILYSLLTQNPQPMSADATPAAQHRLDQNQATIRDNADQLAPLTDNLATNQTLPNRAQLSQLVNDQTEMNTRPIDHTTGRLHELLSVKHNMHHSQELANMIDQYRQTEQDVTPQQITEYLQEHGIDSLGLTPNQLATAINQARTSEASQPEPASEQPPEVEVPQPAAENSSIYVDPIAEAEDQPQSQPETDNTYIDNPELQNIINELGQNPYVDEELVQLTLEQAGIDTQVPVDTIVQRIQNRINRNGMAQIRTDVQAMTQAPTMENLVGMLNHRNVNLPENTNTQQLLTNLQDQWHRAHPEPEVPAENQPTAVENVEPETPEEETLAQPQVEPQPTASERGQNHINQKNIPFALQEGPRMPSREDLELQIVDEIEGKAKAKADATKAYLEREEQRKMRLVKQQQDQRERQAIASARFNDSKPELNEAYQRLREESGMLPSGDLFDTTPPPPPEKQPQTKAEEIEGQLAAVAEQVQTQAAEARARQSEGNAIIEQPLDDNEAQQIEQAAQGRAAELEQHAQKRIEQLSSIDWTSPENRSGYNMLNIDLVVDTQEDTDRKTEQLLDYIEQQQIEEFNVITTALRNPEFDRDTRRRILNELKQHVITEQLTPQLQRRIAPQTETPQQVTQPTPETPQPPAGFLRRLRNLFSGN